MVDENLIICASTPTDYAQGSSVGLPCITSRVDTAWADVDATDFKTGNHNVIDTNSLLSKSDMEKPTLAACGVEVESLPNGKKKRACKNCTCGLAELEANEDKTSVAAAAAKSSCGNVSFIVNILN